MNRFVFFGMVMIGLVLPLFADTYHTPEIWYVDDDQTGTGDGSPGNPFATIMEGIDAAVDTDVVRVKDGTYYENIDFNGKAITVRSDSSNPEDCIIDGGQNGPCCRFVNDEGRGSILKGFSLTNGSGEYWECWLGGVPLKANNIGGAIYGWRSGPVIRDNYIYDNFTRPSNSGYPGIDGTHGGGIAFSEWCPVEWTSDNDYSFPKIHNNKIYQNTTGGINGWACLIQGGNIEFTYNEIYDNYCTLESQSEGCGIVEIRVYSSADDSTNIVEGNRIYNNDYPEDWDYGFSPKALYVNSGAEGGDDTILYFRNNIIADNQEIDHLFCGGFDIVYFVNNTFYGCVYPYTGRITFYSQEWSNWYSDVYAYNNIVWYDTYTPYNGYAITVSKYVKFRFDYNCITSGSSNIYDGTTGDGYVTYGYNNITTDPDLEDPGPTGYDYHLDSESDCIDVGIDTYAPERDFEGDSRPYNDDYDIGADEYTG